MSAHLDGALNVYSGFAQGVAPYTKPCGYADVRVAPGTSFHTRLGKKVACKGSDLRDGRGLGKRWMVVRASYGGFL